MSPFSILKITKKKLPQNKKTLCYPPSRSVLLFLILKICKKKIDFKQVNKNLFIPLTSKKSNIVILAFKNVFKIF